MGCFNVVAFRPRPVRRNGVEEAQYLRFHDTLNEWSLANWLYLNVDMTAKTAWGLSVFVAPLEEINSPRWRRELLTCARRWYQAARKLHGRETLIGRPHLHPVLVSPQASVDFIRKCSELLTFAEGVHRDQLDVYVTEHGP